MPEKMNDSRGKPLVTAVVTTYNRPQMVQRAIQSILAQTYEPLEIIVVEDGIDSGIKAWLKQKSLNHVRYYRHETNKGLSAARNTGISKSRGEYIAFLDDDDEWKPDALEKRIAFSEKKQEELGVVYCGCEIHIPHENRITYNMPKIEGNIKKYIINHDLSTIPSSCLFPGKVLQVIGGFDESLGSSIDHDIWMNLAVHGYHAFAVK